MLMKKNSHSTVDIVQYILSTHSTSTEFSLVVKFKKYKTAHKTKTP